MCLVFNDFWNLSYLDKFNRIYYTLSNPCVNYLRETNIKTHTYINSLEKVDIPERWKPIDKTFL